jgi:hypothetical protein
MARPPVEIEFRKLKELMRFKPRLLDAAAFFECSEDTIERRIKEETGLSFAEFREQNMVHTRMSLIQTALKKASAGDNVMLIFCLKNLCDWSDKVVVGGEADKPIEIKLTYNTKEDPAA